MADVTQKHKDIADQSDIYQLWKDVGSSQHVPGVMLVDSAGAMMGSGGALVARPAITVDTAAYVAGECMGGIITLANFFPTGGGKAKITSIVITEIGSQTPALTLLWYKATPAGGTYTDNSALAVDATDVDDETGVPIQVVAGDYRTVGNTAHRKAALTFLPFIVEGASTSLFMLVQLDAAYDMVTAGDFKIRIGYERVG